MLRLQHDETVAIVTLNRPQAKNALCSDLLRDLSAVFARLRDDETAHGIVLTGAGNCFCAGADIGEMRGLTTLEAAMFSETGQRLAFAIETVGKPVIAAVNGPALGGGMELALACDFILAGESAAFAQPEILLGIIPGFGGTQRLSRLVGKSKAKEMIFTGERLTAGEAHAIGLVNRVLADDALLPDAIALMKSIASRGGLSLRMAKEIIDGGYDVDLRNACLMERDAFALCFSTEEQKEGMTAFLEKRPARFQGR
jgi:enoyl-CoA hydratase